MALPDILNAIETDTLETLSQMRKTHQQKMLEMKRETEGKLEEYATKIAQQKQQKMKQMHAKARSLGLQRKRHAVLRKKQELINAAYDALLEDLSAQDPSRFEQFFSRCIEAIGHGEGVIRPCERHRALLEKLTAGKAFLSVDESIPAKGGFRFVGKDKERDFTFEHLLLTGLKPETELMVAQHLFS